MSYSTWKTSRWFTFWDVAAAHEKNREVFDIAGICSFTYYQLAHDMKECLKRVKGLDKKASEEELDELEVYMKLFLKEIDEHHARGTFKI